MRGYSSTFHRFTAGDLVFLGGLFGFCVLFVLCWCCWVGFVLCVLLSTIEILFQFTSLNDRLSCHGAHGMGEKKSIHLQLA